jgi:hypothetical protein
MFFISCHQNCGNSVKTIEAIVTVVTTRYISHGYVSGVASEITGSTSLSTASSEDHVTVPFKLGKHRRPLVQIWSSPC